MSLKDQDSHHTSEETLPSEEIQIPPQKSKSPRKVKRVLSEEEKLALSAERQKKNEQKRLEKITRGLRKGDLTVERDKKRFLSKLESWRVEGALPSPNLNRLGALKRRVAKLGALYPDLLQESGLDPALWVSETSRVMEYGSTGKIVIRTDDGRVVSDGVTISDVMRGKHECYNLLLETCIPVRNKIRRLLEGQKWAEGVAHQAVIEAVYEKKNRQTFIRMEEMRKRNPNQALIEKCEEEIAAFEKELEGLKKTRSEMQVGIWKEIYENTKLHETALTALKREREKVVKETLKLVRPRGAILQGKGYLKSASGIQFSLSDGDYEEIERAVKQSFDASLKAKWVDRAESHFRYEGKDGERPENLINYAKWNGEGTLSVALHQKERKISVEDVMGGKGRYVRIRPLSVEDLPIYGLNSEFLDKRATRCERISILEAKGKGRPERIQTLRVVPRSQVEDEELRKLTAQETELQRLMAANERVDVSAWYVVSMRMGEVKSGLWTTVPIKLHRALSENPKDKVHAVSLHVKKNGLRKDVEVKFTVNKELTPLKTGGDTVEVHTCSLVMPDGRVKVATLTGVHETNTDLYLPKRISNSLHKAERMQGYLKEHLSYARAKLKTLKLCHPTLGDSFDPQSRSNLRYGFREWVKYLKTKHGEDSAQALLSGIFSKLRNIHAENKDLSRKAGAYGGDYDLAWVMATQEFCDAFGMTRSEASVLAVLSLFVDRYDHLHSWATTLRDRALLYRREIYRTMAARLASSYGTVRYLEEPNTSCTSYIEQCQIDRLIALSILKGALKNATSRERITFLCK